MTVSTETTKSAFLAYATGTDTYNWGSFSIPTSADVKVYAVLDDGDGARELLTPTTHYTADVGANTITLTTAGHTYIQGLTGYVLADTDLVIYREIAALTQTSDFTNQGAFLSQNLEDSYDLIYYVLQQHEEQLRRCVQVDPWDPVLDGYADDEARLAALTIPTLTGANGGVIYWNATDATFEISSTLTTADLLAVAAITSDITTVAAISANVTTVAGISANVTTVAGISANVTTVAGISADVTAVAGNAADITTVAGDLTGDDDIGAVAARVGQLDEIVAAIDSFPITRHDDAAAIRSYYALATYGAVTSIPHAVVDGGTGDSRNPQYYVWSPAALGADDGVTILQPTGQTTGRFVLRGSVSKSQIVADYTELKALGLGESEEVLVADDERGGMFIWRSGDQSTQVTNDPGEGVWVPPSSDTTGASGAWERLVGTAARAEWWEIDAAHSGSSTDIDDEWDNLMTYLENRSLDKGITVDFPPYNFFFDTQPDAIRGANVVFRCAGSPYSTVFNRNYTPGAADEPFIEAQAKTHWDKIAISAPSGMTGGTAFGIWKNNDQFSVSGVTLNGNDPVRVTFSSAHSYKDRMAIAFSSVGGTTELNGNTYYINYISSTVVELVGTDSANFTAWTSGGVADGAANGGDFSIIDPYITGSSTFANGIYCDGAYYNDNHTSVSDGVRDIVVRGSIFQTTSAGFYGDAIIGLDFNAGVFTASDDAIKITGNTDAGGGINSANINIRSVTLGADLDIDYCTLFSVDAGIISSAINIGANASRGSITAGEAGNTTTIAGDQVVVNIGRFTSDITISGDNNTVNGFSNGAVTNSGANNAGTALDLGPFSGISGSTYVGIAEGAAINQTAVGFNANTGTGQSNVAVGTSCGNASASGIYNVIAGVSAGVSLAGANNSVILGYNSGAAMAGSSNTVCVGASSLSAATGANNTALGFQAGNNITTGTNNIVLGFQAAASSATVSNEITIGNSSITKLRLPGSVVIENGGTQILTTQRTGWTSPTGTASRAALAATETDPATIAAAVVALIEDLGAHGLIDA